MEVMENADQAVSTAVSSAEPTQSTESQSTSTDQSSSSPQTEQTSSSPASEGAVQPAVSQFVPNYEFKFYDKTEKFPEWIRPLIKDKDSEEQVRGVFAKAYALDELRGKYDKTREQVEEVRTKFSTQTNQIKELMALRENDLGGFLQAVGLTDDMLAQHYDMLRKAKEDPTFAKQYEASLEAKRNHLRTQKEKETLSEEMERIKEERESVLRERHEFTFEQAFSNPAVQSVASEYDKRLGGEGSFKEEVRALGSYFFQVEKRYVPPQELMNIMVQKYSPILGLQPQTPQSVQAPAQMAAKSQPATIPNVGGGGASVTKQRFKSLDDIKKHYEKTYGDN